MGLRTRAECGLWGEGCDGCEECEGRALTQGTWSAWYMEHMVHGTWYMELTRDTWS